MLMQWTTSKIRLILRLYLEQRTRPGLLLPVMIMCSSSGNSWLGLGRRCALDHSQVATSCQPWWLLKSTAYVWSSFSAFSINWVLSKLSDLVNSVKKWKQWSSGKCVQASEGSADCTLLRMSSVSQASLLHSSCSMLLTEFGSGKNCSLLFLGSYTKQSRKLSSCVRKSSRSPNYFKKSGEDSCLKLTESISLLQSNLSQENLNSASSLQQLNQFSQYILHDIIRYLG